jgi:glycerol-3-phosphate acyltransferase PlsY
VVDSCRNRLEVSKLKTLLAILWILCGYLLGSIPFAYIAGKILRGIDIRHYGTHNVGGSNVYVNVSKPAIVIVGILDMAKAGFAYWMGMRLGMGLGISLAAGVAGIVGHDWPIYLRFHGGRGLSASMGVLVMAFPLGFIWTLFMTAMGYLFGKNAAITLAGIVTLPALAHYTSQPREVAWTTAVILLLVVVKRLEANREVLPPGHERWQVLARRVLLDRDIEDWETWAHRRPDGSENSRGAG